MGILQPSLFGSACLLCLAALVLIFKRRLNVYSAPFLLFIIINLCGIAAIIIETGQFPDAWSLGYFLLFIYLAYLPTSWYFLSAHWGLDRQAVPRRTVLTGRVLAVISVLLPILFFWRSGIDVATVDGRWFVELGRWRFWLSAFFIIALTVGAYAMEICYRSSLGLSREKIRRSFLALLAGAIGYLAVATIAILYGRVLDWLLTLAFVISALVSIPLVRHYLTFDSAADGIIITRKGVYSSIVIVIFGVYFLFIGLVGMFLVKYNLDEGAFFTMIALILIVATFLLLVFSQTFRSRFRAISVPGTPYSDKSSYGAEWKEFTEEVSVSLNLDTIYNRSHTLLYRLLKIEDSAFIVAEPAPSENFTLYSGERIRRGITGERLRNLAAWLYRFGHPVEVSTLRENGPREIQDIAYLEDKLPFDIFLLVPFVARQQFLGFWIIGPHASGRGLSSDEIGFVEAAANPVALTILGARMTDELMATREMESFHRFSSFVLHDLKNSVGMLSMLLHNAERNIDNPDFQKEALTTIAKAVARQEKIISRLTGEHTDDTLSLERLDLAVVIDATLSRVRLDTVTSVRVRVETAPGIIVLADPDKIGSVFDNLVMNAVEAMPEGGDLGISLSGEGDTATVTVRDSGVGMDADFIATRLFKPFSSTKSHGLGIGMYQSREIIRQHRGCLDVVSEPGKGTEFIVSLPKEG